ncbi:hypothetical protein HNP86_001899 [Methanococcus maripaludis]|uniref:Uncharacterized protein n=1 Tax=Methanococcus maripaludis TaxID=39152 RepID=A0A7J9NVN2_METMI|nr:hypothetical protein [Methanococcus maripaludis]MBA2851740.1 hypothetical protein [Methanococcus maripaludis]
MENNVTNEVFLVWLLQYVLQQSASAGVFMLSILTVIIAYIMQPEFELLRILNVFLVMDVLTMTVKQFSVQTEKCSSHDFSFSCHVREFIGILLKSATIGMTKGLSLIMLYECVVLLNQLITLMGLSFDFTYTVIPILVLYARWIMLNLFQLPFIRTMFPQSFIDRILAVLEGAAINKR